jgi:putative copper export protein
VTFVRYLHLLAMAFFVGGQLVLAAAVVPVARGTPHMREMARRFGYGTLVALAVLIATGTSMASRFHRWSDGTLHIKLALVAVAGVLVLVHIRKPSWRALDGAIFAVSLAIVWLGVALAH